MFEVWKYSFEMQDNFKLSMPEQAQILAVQLQKGKPYIWALVDPSKNNESRRFRLAGTGHPIYVISMNYLSYIGSFQMRKELIFHLFEVKV